MDDLDPGCRRELGTLTGLINDATAPAAFALALVALAAESRCCWRGRGLRGDRVRREPAHTEIGVRGAPVPAADVLDGAQAGRCGGDGGRWGRTRRCRAAHPHTRAMLFGVSPTDAASYAVLTG